MSALDLPKLNQILSMARILRSGFDASLFNLVNPISQIVESSTDYFTPSNKDKRHQDFMMLEVELSDRFLSMTESKLQDRFANHLIFEMQNLLGPLYGTIEFTIDDYQHASLNRMIPKKTEEIEFLNWKFCTEIISLVESWIFFTRKTVKIFASECYSEHSSTLDKLIPEYNELGEVIEPSTESTQPKQLETNLQWIGDKTDLAELVWVLAKSERIKDSSTGKPITQKELAKQVKNLFEFDSLDVANLMKGRYGTNTKPTTYKVKDGKNFINTLQTLLNKEKLD